jgi:hypothetical protein
MARSHILLRELGICNLPASNTIQDFELLIRQNDILIVQLITDRSPPVGILRPANEFLDFIVYSSLAIRALHHYFAWP